jgi:hypothetical protein
MDPVHKIKIVVSAIVTAVLFAVYPTQALGPTALEISPQTFDFGWSPDNAKISCEFKLRNTGTGLISLTSVQPACGCTATNFHPEELSSAEETTIGLTFNTRGYTGMKFNKTAKVKADIAEGEYTVNLKGHVTDSDAKVVPVGDGVAGFEPSEDVKRRTIQIENKGSQTVRLEVIQPPADWALVKLKKTSIPPGKTVELDVSVEGSVEETRDTSITLAALADKEINRLTIAVRTGKPPPPYRRYVPPPQQNSGQPGDQTQENSTAN